MQVRLRLLFLELHSNVSISKQEFVNLFYCAKYLSRERIEVKLEENHREISKYSILLVKEVINRKD